MQTHDVQPKTKRKTKKIVGRGGLRGKTSGRGHKGQNARAGNSNRPAIRDIIKKIPKLRGYRFNSHRIKAAVINVGDLAESFQAGDTVTKAKLAEKGLVVIGKDGKKPVKVLGDGDIGIKLAITDDISVSASAHAKIIAAGGSIAQ